MLKIQAYKFKILSLRTNGTKFVEGCLMQGLSSRETKRQHGKTHVLKVKALGFGLNNQTSKHIPIEI